MRPLRLPSLPVGSDQVNAGEWLKVAFPHNQGFENESDPALTEALNEISNLTLTALLKEDEEEILSIQDELFKLGEFFSNQGNRDAALFMFVLHQMSNHEVPKASESLTGIYDEAFCKLGGILEDSGWELKMEESETDQTSHSENE